MPAQQGDPRHLAVHAPATAPATTGAPAAPATPDGLACFNAVPAEVAEELLLSCCHSPRWAERVTAHRPYPTLDALLAAADEAGYDLSVAERQEALAAESSAAPHPDAPPAAHTALRAAHAAYESRFGHAFVISLDGVRPGERLDQVLAGIRSRLANEAEEERVVAADELRRLARARLAHHIGVTLAPDAAPSPGAAPTPGAAPLPGAAPTPVQASGMR
ncbi:2-oxo-4-hydroxy-4-carboxy-5-ureidoimidazoline decarboxylase [Streptomyces sp. NPDC013457]|uniref:2-oxo-4-hydroxy-4-carboxy-5-ureidoimidazoline decarboxylase n=1 Tax=Streptomyces sp. NPDC013457 TaxID=3364866 RepID=UPI0036F6D8BD